MQSRFRFHAFMPAFLLVFIAGLTGFVYYLLQTSHEPVPLYFTVLTFGFFIAMFIWIGYGELRTKAIRITIETYQIEVSRYLGLGATQVYYLSDFEGYETAILPAKHGSYEFLYLVSNGRRVIKLSEYYHQNYHELKGALGKKLTHLGEQPFIFLEELKEIFL